MVKNLDEQYNLKDLYLGVICKVVGTQSYGTNSQKYVIYQKKFYGVCVKTELNKFKQISTGVSFEGNNSLLKKGDFFVDNPELLVYSSHNPCEPKLTKEKIVEMEKDLNKTFIKTHKANKKTNKGKGKE